MRLERSDREDNGQLISEPGGVQTLGNIGDGGFSGMLESKSPPKLGAFAIHMVRDGEVGKRLLNGLIRVL